MFAGKTLVWPRLPQGRALLLEIINPFLTLENVGIPNAIECNISDYLRILRNTWEYLGMPVILWNTREYLGIIENIEGIPWNTSRVYEEYSEWSTPRVSNRRRYVPKIEKLA